LEQGGKVWLVEFLEQAVGDPLLQGLQRCRFVQVGQLLHGVGWQGQLAQGQAAGDASGGG
jgi:hypothetical protein